jgi:Heterokaryon incompatibility protein (HET)
MLVLEMLKPSLYCPAEYKRNEFKAEFIPQDLAQEKVQLKFETESGETLGHYDDNHDIEFMMWLVVGSAYLSCIRREEPADLITRNSRYGRLPWLATTLEESTSKLLDIKQFRERLEQCHQSHSMCITIQRATSIDTEYRTLFIDVDQGCLVHGTLGQRYFALSYVWGNASTIRTTQKNLAELMQPDSLGASNEAISRVARDAISLTRKLGERFLWIDMLCIIQDDALNKSRHISNMDLIYKQAALTIIAHSGMNSDSPLPGIIEGTRFPIVRSQQIGGLKVISQSTSLGSPSISSRYDTRGWTYQEETLSPRRLYIYHTHASFECCTSKYFDVIDREEEVNHRWYSSASSVVAHLQHRHATKESGGPLEFDAEHYRLYLDTVRGFSSRNLTLQSDRLNAFSGMIKVLEKLFETPFCNGLPERFIDVALLWSSHPKGDYKYHEWGYEANLKIYLRNLDFSSWSWLGHNYALEGYNGFALGKILSEIAGFAVLSPGSGQSRWISRSVSCPLVDLAKGDRDISQEISPEALSRVALAQRTSILCFFGRLVDGDYLLVDGHPSRLCSGRIFTAGTEWFCGLLYPDDSEVWRSPPRGRRHWIILSRGCVSGQDGPDFEKEEGISYSEHFNQEKFKIWCKWTFYHVMLVEERGDVVERLAIGSIHIDAWPLDKERHEMVFLG